MARSGKKRGAKLAMSIAAVGVATSVAGVAATQPASISTSLVDLAALIVVGSSTNLGGAGVPRTSSTASSTTRPTPDPTVTTSPT